MADIELVIRIPEEEYKCVQITGCIGNKTCISNAIYNGTPLPKGHGDLKDADAILEEPFGNTYRDINIAETIIEADKER